MKDYSFKINGRKYDVTINGIENNVADVCVNGVKYSVELPEQAAPAAKTAPAAAVHAVPAEPAKPAAASPAVPAAGAATVTSPLPGVIIDICVKEGESVKRGQKLAVLEAMKMENDILATQDGTVSAICVSKGDSVLEGAKILVLA